MKIYTYILLDKYKVQWKKETDRNEMRERWKNKYT